MVACARWAVGHGPVPAFAAMDDDGWHRLLAEARGHRMAGAVAAAVMESGALAGTRWEQIADLEREWALHTLRAERTLLDVVATLDDAGIEHRVLKGSAFAHVHWPAPEMRVFGDADVLVRSEDMDAAVAAVLAVGGERLVPEVRRGFDRRFGKSVTMRSAERVEIDLHRMLVAGPHAFLVPENDLWEAPLSFQVGGRSLLCLPAETALVHAAVHAVASLAPRLPSLLDVAFVAESADLGRTAEVAAQWKVRPLVREAGARLAGELGLAGQPVVDWADGLGSSAEEDELFELFVGTTSFRRTARATVPYIPRPVDRLRFLASLAWPSRAHRRAR